MKYQLVLQLYGSSLEDLDKLVELEDRIISVLRGLGTVDGHDMGSGEANIFILTDAPQEAFERIQISGVANDVMASLRVAYREAAGNSFTLVHPPGLLRFKIT
jgi:hypothetical protein